jgi:hypothetical protein
MKVSVIFNYPCFWMNRGAIRKDAVAFTFRLCTGAEAHGVEMGSKDKPGQQIDEQIIGLGRQLDAFVCVVGGGYERLESRRCGRSEKR